MEINDIISLANAGFKVDQIMQIIEKIHVSSENNTTIPDNEIKIIEQKENDSLRLSGDIVNSETNDNKKSKEEDSMLTVINEIKNLTKAIQSNGILNSTLKEEKKETADDALKAIFNQNVI